MHESNPRARYVSFSQRSPMDLHRTNSFVAGRSRMHACTCLACVRACVRVAIRESADVRRLSCMHQNWFAPDTGLAIEWRVSMRSRCSSSSPSPDLSLSLSFSAPPAFLLPRLLLVPVALLRLGEVRVQITRTSPLGRSICFFGPRCLLSWDKISWWSSETRRARGYILPACRPKPIPRLIASQGARRLRYCSMSLDLFDAPLRGYRFTRIPYSSRG